MPPRHILGNAVPLDVTSEAFLANRVRDSLALSLGHRRSVFYIPPVATCLLQVPVPPLLVGRANLAAPPISRRLPELFEIRVVDPRLCAAEVVATRALLANERVTGPRAGACHQGLHDDAEDRLLPDEAKRDRVGAAGGAVSPAARLQPQLAQCAGIDALIGTRNAW